jgi:hypothetical protein
MHGQTRSRVHAAPPRWVCPPHTQPVCRRNAAPPVSGRGKPPHGPPCAPAGSTLIARTHHWRIAPTRLQAEAARRSRRYIAGRPPLGRRLSAHRQRTVTTVGTPKPTRPRPRTSSPTPPGCQPRRQITDVLSLKAPKSAPDQIRRGVTQHSSSASPTVCGAFAEPSSGLEPETPSLPCDPNGNGGQPLAKVGRYFKPLSAVRRGERLPGVAPSLFHNCSIPIDPKRAV